VQIPAKAAIFAEILRVLRPGGRFIASDWLRGGSGAYSPEMTEFFYLDVAIGTAGICRWRSANSSRWKARSGP
jgi:phosphoethanolamine N-methyltransferase